MKASELIELLQKAIDKVGDVNVKGVHSDDYFGGVELFDQRYVYTTNKGNIVISSTYGFDDAHYKFEEVK